MAPTLIGLGALESLAAIGTCPEELRPVLRGFAFCPLRLLGRPLFPEEPHPDERLRSAAWRLLTA